jgi:phage terminase large subunit GpA-like protein
VNRIYEFARRFPKRVYPTKGRPTQDKPVTMSRQEVKSTGALKKHSQVDLVLLDTDWCKSWVHERIRWPTMAPGAWALPFDATEDYCKQIVSEARTRKPNGQPEWVRRSRNNHMLDCEAMQAGLYHMLNLHMIRDPVATEPARVVLRSPTTGART